MMVGSWVRHFSFEIVAFLENILILQEGTPVKCHGHNPHLAEAMGPSAAKPSWEKVTKMVGWM